MHKEAEEDAFSQPKKGFWSRTSLQLFKMWLDGEDEAKLDMHSDGVRVIRDR